MSEGVLESWGQLSLEWAGQKDTCWVQHLGCNLEVREY